MELSFMNNYIKDKVVIITGAGSGFGRLLAQKVAKMGGKTVICARTKENIGETVALIKAEGGEASGMAGDVSKYADNEALVELAVKTYGRLDVFVANAGIMPNAPWSTHRTSLPTWEKCIDTNLKGCMYAISASYDQMIEQGQGHFVAMSSIFGNYPVVTSGVYQSTKIGIRFLASTLNKESRGKIKASIVNPTGVPTTNLNSTVLDTSALVGICGHNLEEYMDYKARLADGSITPEELSNKSIRNWLLTSEDITEGVIYVINQPWGVNVSEITLRAPNEPYIL